MTPYEFLARLRPLLAEAEALALDLPRDRAGNPAGPGPTPAAGTLLLAAVGLLQQALATLKRKEQPQ